MLVINALDIILDAWRKTAIIPIDDALDIILDGFVQDCQLYYWCIGHVKRLAQNFGNSNCWCIVVTTLLC